MAIAEVLDEADLQFLSRGAARFKCVRLLHAQVSKKEREPSDSIGGDDFREDWDVGTIDVAFQQLRKRFDREKRVGARGRR